jgi:FkbM family methyltransferase
MLAAVLVGPAGHVIAVEPWSENCRLLLASLHLNGFDQVELWPVALDRTRHWAHFMTHVGSNGGLIGDDADDLASGRGTIVPTFPLDELLGDDRPVDLVKIDVEGAEHRVLMGAQRSLERCRPVVFSEFSAEMTRRVSGIDPVEYPRWFTSRGWSLSVVDRGDGSLRPFATPEDLMAWWPHPLHQEDLLFLPET